MSLLESSFSVKADKIWRFPAFEKTVRTSANIYVISAKAGLDIAHKKSPYNNIEHCFKNCLLIVQFCFLLLKSVIAFGKFIGSPTWFAYFHKDLKFTFKHFNCLFWLFRGSSNFLLQPHYGAKETLRKTWETNFPYRTQLRWFLFRMMF